MRFLLAGILVFLPSIVQAAPLDCANADHVDRQFAADSADPEHQDDLHGLIELEPYHNPYSPASPTNFEALVEPYLFVQGRGGVILYDHHFPGPFVVGDQERNSSFNHHDASSLFMTEPVARTPAASVRWFTDR